MACNTSKVTEYSKLSVAQELIKVVPTIVAMQFPYYDNRSHLFTKNLFAYLKRDNPIIKSIRQIRLELKKLHAFDWGGLQYIHKLGMLI